MLPALFVEWKTGNNLSVHRYATDQHPSVKYSVAIKKNKLYL